jgi:hypothetical protein
MAFADTPQGQGRKQIRQRIDHNRFGGAQQLD